MKFKNDKDWRNSTEFCRSIKKSTIFRRKQKIKHIKFWDKCIAIIEANKNFFRLISYMNCVNNQWQSKCFGVMLANDV